MDGTEGSDEVRAWAARAAAVDVGGEAVAVVDTGSPPAAADGPPLLVVHGFPTSSVDFAPVLERLSAGRRVVLLDLPGYGLSSKADRAYSLFGQADAVEAVAAHAGLGEVDLLTHDMGDTVGGEVLARTLEGASSLSVRRRVLTNGSIYLAMAHLTDGQQLLRSLPDEALPAGRGVDADALAASLLALCGPNTGDAGGEPARHLRVGAELAVRAGGGRLLPRLIRYLDERARHEGRWTGAVESHPSPLAVVWGRHDPIAVAPMVDRLVERRPDAAVTWLDAGHWPMVERPREFADAVVQALVGR
jgi:pimeloyl-ACP methyl ester carboxylesterase